MLRSIGNVVKIKYDFNKRHFIARSLFIMSQFYVFALRVRVYVLHELLSSIMLCALLSRVNMCACHMYFTINLLTYFKKINVSVYRERKCVENYNK